MKVTVVDEDGSRGRTNCQYPKETVLLQGETGLMSVVTSVSADTQPETQEPTTTLTASKPFWRTAGTVINQNVVSS